MLDQGVDSARANEVIHGVNAVISMLRQKASPSLLQRYTQRAIVLIDNIPIEAQEAVKAYVASQEPKTVKLFQDHGLERSTQPSISRSAPPASKPKTQITSTQDAHSSVTIVPQSTEIVEVTKSETALTKKQKRTNQVVNIIKQELEEDKEAIF